MIARYLTILVLSNAPLAVGGAANNWELYLRLAILVAALIIVAHIVVASFKDSKSNREKRMELKKSAEDAIVHHKMLDLILSASKSYLWECRNGILIMSDDFQKFTRSDTKTLPVGKLEDSFSEYFSKKVNDFFNIYKPGFYTTEFYGRVHHSDPHWFEVRMTVTDTPEGPVQTGITSIIDDIKAQEAKSLEAARLMANAKEKEDFIMIISHEIRTPLNSILGFSRLLSEQDMSFSEEDFKVFGSAIEENGRILTKMINDMLTLTLMENSNIRVNLVPVDLRTKFQSDFNRWYDLSREYDLGKRKIIITGDNAGGHGILVDIDLFDKVMDNLIGNAVKYSPDGSNIVIKWSVVKDFITISVHNDGETIAKAYRDVIFNRFYKIDPFRPGAGLGLAISKDLVEMMNGSISCVDSNGAGSTFVMSFPKVKLDQ